MSNVESVLLGEIATVQTGPFGSQLHQSDYVKSGIPIVTVEHLGDNRLSHVDVPMVSPEDYDRLSKYILRENDIVFSRVGSVDRRALVRAEESGWLFSGRCLRVRPDPLLVDAVCLSYYFGQESFKEHVRQIAVGATMPSLNTGLLSGIELVLPSLEQQIAIGKLLGSLDDKIELNRRMNETLEEMARTIFRSWFVDFDPVRIKARGGDPVKELGISPEIAALFPDSFEDSELGQIPKGWNLSDIKQWSSNIFSGGTPDTRRPEFWGGGVPWLSSGETRNKLVLRTEKTITREGVENSSTRQARRGDIVIASAGQGNTRGQTSLLCLDTFVNQSVVVIRPVEPGLSTWLYLNLSSRYEEMRTLSDGSSSRGSLTTKIIGAMSCINPPVKLLKRFHCLATPFFTSIESNLLENLYLAKTRDYLLPKLLSGTISIGEGGQVG